MFLYYHYKCIQHAYNIYLSHYYYIALYFELYSRCRYKQGVFFTLKVKKMQIVFSNRCLVVHRHLFDNSTVAGFRRERNDLITYVYCT